nr:MAG TPA: hypothetical protein [Caudoviricetes sp.]
MQWLFPRPLPIYRRSFPPMPPSNGIELAGAYRS